MILLISSGLDSPTVRLRHLGYLLLLFFSGLRFSRFASLRVVFVLGGAGGWIFLVRAFECCLTL